MVVGRHGDRSQRFRPDPVLVHEARDPGCEELRRRQLTVGQDQRVLARHGGKLRPLAEAAELALRERAIDDDALGEATGDRRRGVRHRAGYAAAPAPPLHVGEAQLVDAQRRGERHRLVAIIAERGEAVDAVRVDSRVLARREDSLEAKSSLRPRRPRPCRADLGYSSWSFLLRAPRYDVRVG